jgi:hypothetical protein
MASIMQNEQITIVVEIPESNVCDDPYIPEELIAPTFNSSTVQSNEYRNEKKYNDILFARNDPTAVNDIVILLDKSGSMELLGEEPIQSVKAFIQTQYDKAVAEPDPTIQKKLLNVRIQVILFNDTADIIVDAKVLELDQLPLTYKPYGMTDLYSPLYDIFMKNKNAPKDIIIVSDGQSNTGGHNASFVKRQITRAMDAGWTLRFVGCTMDSMVESYKLGLQQFTSDCSQDYEGNAPTLYQVMCGYSDKVSQENRARTMGSQSV